ncbi:MAG: hypothetical protein AAF620_19800 [Bacteroidota bacterium]
MSRSKRKTPKRGITGATSEKEDKRDANRKLRRKAKQQVHKGDEILSELREVSDVWALEKMGSFMIKTCQIKRCGNSFFKSCR